MVFVCGFFFVWFFFLTLNNMKFIAWIGFDCLKLNKCVECFVRSDSN